MAPCNAPDLGERLLDHRRDAQLPGELILHLAHCSACQIAVERRRRLVASWDHSELSAAEILRLRVRLAPSSTRGRAARRRGHALLGYALAALAATSAFAAGARIIGRHEQSTNGPEKQRAVQMSPAKGGSLPHTPALPASVGEPALPVPVEATTSESASLERPDVSAPGSSTRPRSDQASHAHRAPLSASDSHRTSANQSARPAQDPRWADAADALRRSDDTAAERSLKSLEASSDAGTRDAARLTLAELWLHQGQGARAHGVLAELAAGGATPLVRARASDLLKLTNASSAAAAAQISPISSSKMLATP